MAVRPIHNLLFGGKSTPAIRAISFSLSLTLAMFGVCADHPNHPAAVNHFALHADFLYRCPNFHLMLRSSLAPDSICSGKRSVHALNRRGKARPPRDHPAEYE